MQEIGHPATLFPMVEAGIGISVLPALALPCRRKPAGGEAVDARCRTKADAGAAKNRSLSGAAQAIWEVVRIQHND